MRNYELMLAIRGSHIESEAMAAYEEVKAFLASLQAEITYEESWGKIDTAYTMSGENQAYYTVLRMNLSGEATKTIEKEFNINRSVIRYLLTSVEDAEAPIFTKADYDAGIEAFYQSKQERKKQAMPKTRATTAIQLKEDMAKLKDKKESKVKKAESAIDKELSL